MTNQKGPWEPIKFPSSVSFVITTPLTPSEDWLKRLKSNIKGLSPEQVLKKYMGFEAKSHEYFPPTEDVNGLINIIGPKSHELSLLLVIPDPQSFHPIGNPVKLGYDVGRCEEEDGNVYSSIFHEILFGHVQELAAYGDVLNNHLLFPTLSKAKQYVEFHDKLAREGKDVEDYMVMEIYEIWKYTI